MRRCVVQAVMAMVTCGICVAFNNYGQILEKKVTLQLREVSIETALKEITAKTQVRFAYSKQQLDLSYKISLDVVDAPLGEILNDVLTPINVAFIVHETELSIVLKNQHPSSQASNRKTKSPVVVSGTVSNGEGLPMPGVNIVVKGTTAGTTTDAAGAYSISVEEGSTLVFSFIGYKPVEIRVDNRTSIDVRLEEDSTKLSEVIVNAGYYSTTKAVQTGNIVKIGASEIQVQPVSNPIAALQGRVSGVEIIQQNGVPGSNFKVRIRGTNSIANGNDPLYIIDGVPFSSAPMSMTDNSSSILGSSDPLASQGYSPLNAINPSDIESIEILKDADATAIYGSRGANGVVLITTKKGTTGKPKIDLNFYSGVAQVPNRMDLLNSSQYVRMRNEAFANDKVIPTATNAPDIMVWDTTRYTNWQKELIGGTAGVTDAQLSISGGDRSTQFVIGSGYHRETTVFPGKNSDQRISFHTNVSNNSFNDRLKTSVSINYSRNYTDLPGRDLTFNALTLPPIAPTVYDDAGNISWTNWSASLENPMIYQKRTYESTASNLIGNSVLNYSILPNLQARLNMGYTSMSMDGISLLPVSSVHPSASNKINQSIFSSTRFENWLAEPQLNWKPKVGNHAFDVLVGSTFMNQVRQGVAQTAAGFSSESLMRNIASAPTITAGSNYFQQYRYQSIFSRVNYNLKGKYIVNLTARRDGSSRFGPGKQFAMFGAVGAAWIFTREDFVTNAIPFLSFGKLKISYGTTGNDQIGDYQYLDTYRTSGTYQNKSGLTPSRLSNPDFAWETNTKLEGGLDLGFFNDRINLSASYYRNRSSNQLIGFPLAPTTGFSSVQSNFPAIVQNSGLEIGLTTSNIATAKIKWTTSINYTIPRNKLVAFPNIDAFPVYTATYIIGKPLDIQKLYQYTGIDPITGYYKVYDYNADGAFGIADRQVAKFFGRNHFGGILNTVSIGAFQIDVLFQYVNQKAFLPNRIFQLAPGAQLNQPASVMEGSRSSEGGELQIFTRGGLGQSAYSNWQASDGALTSGSFARLKNFSVAYSVPDHILNKIRLVKGSVFVQGQNLMTFTKYKGINPESLGATLPALRTITIGLRVTI